MEKFPDGELYRSSKLTQPELTDLFITILSELHSTKKSLVQYIPFIASKVLAEDVKMLLIQSAAAINGQLIRLSLAKSLLGIELNAPLPMLNGGLNLHDYLKGSIDVKSPKTDAIILAHLVIIEGIEIDAFGLLRRLALNIKPNSLLQLMSVSYKEAIENKKALEALLAIYN